MLLKPVAKRIALPEDLAIKFWGPNTEDVRERQAVAAMDRDSTPEAAQRDLTDLSDTPSLPPGSDIANAGVSSQLGTNCSQAGMETTTSSRIGGGSPTRAQRQRAEGIDPVKMVRNWNKSVMKTRAQRSAHVDGAGCETDDDSDEDTSEEDPPESFDGNQSSSDDSIMVSESAHEPGFDSADAALNRLILQMNATQQLEGDDEHVEGDSGRSSSGHASQRRAISQAPEAPDQITSILRRGNVEVLRGPHSLLMVDRNIMRPVPHSDDEDRHYPPGPAPDAGNARKKHGLGVQTALLWRLFRPFCPDSSRPFRFRRGGKSHPPRSSKQEPGRSGTR